MTSSLSVSALIQGIPDEGELVSPLPGGIAAVVRFFLSFPQPLQIAGLLVVGVLLLVLAVVAWRRRAPLGTWLGTRQREIYIAAAAVAVALVVIAGAAGTWGWNYVQHDNSFCTGCHVMGPAYVRFTESEHSDLECHSCHQQPVTASMRQLYLWVAERPEEIGPHAPVSNSVCITCHVRDAPDERWEAIEAMQGHAVHLESDSSALAEVQCVTCHGRELHRFVPSTQTCGQSGCHEDQESRIAMGRMTGTQTSFHCLTCHEFTAFLPAERVGRGIEAREVPMLPSLEDCAGCHTMERVIDQLNLTDDPHEVECGWCHNPHEQTQTQAVWETCTDSGCHTDPRRLTSFHRGIHGDGVPDCSQCHSPHTWRLEGDDCRSCHQEEELP